MSQSHSHSPAFVDLQGRSLALSLFMFDGCPFCARVIRGAQALGLSLPMRDIRNDPSALAELVRVGGKKTVPCLLVDGRALYESEDILAYLTSQVRPSATKIT